MALFDTLMTPRIDAKIRGRFFACKMKNKRPDFKDILRERFKSKVQQNRRNLIQQFRTCNESSGEIQNSLCDYLCNEIDEVKKLQKFHRIDFGDEEYFFDVEKELEIMQQIQAELLEEQLTWIQEEYCKEEEEIREKMNFSLLCPVCQRGYLEKRSNIISCTRCSVRMFSSISLEDLCTILRETLTQHSKFCDVNPQFTVIDEPNSSGLFLICQMCSSLNAIC